MAYWRVGQLMVPIWTGSTGPAYQQGCHDVRCCDVVGEVRPARNPARGADGDSLLPAAVDYAGRLDYKLSMSSPEGAVCVLRNDGGMPGPAFVGWGASSQDKWCSGCGVLCRQVP